MTLGGGSKFDANRAEVGEGGAVSVQGKVFLHIEGDAWFVRNSAALRGGAIVVLGASNVKIDDAVFVENEANFSGGGAIFVEASSSLYR